MVVWYICDCVLMCVFVSGCGYAQRAMGTRPHILYRGRGELPIIGYMDNREAQEHTSEQSKERRENDERVEA